MSYILDALKKSEQQRGHGSIPNVQTMHSSSLNYHDEKKPYWPYILITAIALNFIAMVYFIIDKNSFSENNTISAQHPGVDNSAENLATVENIQVASHEKPVTLGESAIDEKQWRDTTTTNTENQAEETSTSHPSTDAAIKNTSSINSSKTLSSAFSDNTSINKQPVQPQKSIISFYDLSASIQQQLPAIIVTAHVYSNNPLLRSMVINNNLMEEGEYLIDNLILFEITTDGAIFDYEETRFYYNVVSGWQ